MKASFFSRKPLKLLETDESFAEVQFVIDSCHFISQSNYLNNSNNDCDWLTPLFLAWKIKFGLKIQPNAWGNDRILYHKTNKEASTVLCSVVKHFGSSRALKKWGKTLDFVSSFPLHFFRALPLPACFTTEQSTVEASLFVN